MTTRQLRFLFPVLATVLGLAAAGSARAQNGSPAGYYPMQSLQGLAAQWELWSVCGLEEIQARACQSGRDFFSLDFALPATGAGRPFLLLREDGSLVVEYVSVAKFEELSLSQTRLEYRVDVNGTGAWRLEGEDIMLDLNLGHHFTRIRCVTDSIGYCDDRPESGSFVTTRSSLRLEPVGEGFRLSGALGLLGFDHPAFIAGGLWAGRFVEVSSGQYLYLGLGSANVRPFTFAFGPAGSGGLQANFEGTYLEGVLAPYGFKVDGNWETGGQSAQAQFTYGGQSLLLPLDQGYAEAPDFDYGAEPDRVEADILIGGQIVQTLGLDLDKRTIEPWMRPCASAAGGVCSPDDFSAMPGVLYRSRLAWPISLEATRTLQDASLLTGLFGITGSARSDFGLNLQSDGGPTPGTMDTRFDLQVGRRSLGLGLSGTHDAQLLPSGASLSGEVSTTRAQFDFDKQVGVLDLIPGASAALSALPPGLRARLTAGAGVSIAGSVDVGGEGTYVAAPDDDSLRFDSGALDVQLALQAQLSVLPDFLRGLLRLAFGGGGEVSALIDLFPQAAVREVNGLLRFFMDLQILKLPIIDIDHSWPIGNGAGASPADAITKGAPAIPEDGLPAQADAQLATLRRGTGQAPLLVYSEPDPVRPAPASRIVFARQAPGGTWSRQTLEDAIGVTRFAPTYGQPTSIGGRDDRGVLVWAEASGTPPAAGDIAGIANYLDSSELRFAFVLINASLQASLSPGVAPFRRLTDNAQADFGPQMIQASGDGRSRLFWVRGSGLDLTGESTPLRLLNRNLVAIDFAAPLDNPDTIWSPESDLGGPLGHVLDWRAAAWDADNAAVVVVRDMDGDYTTTGDHELWLLRQAGGVWLPPRRLTDDVHADDAPQLQFLDAETVVLGWRRGEQVVGTLDADAFGPLSEADIWFGVSSGIAANWPRARLQLRPDAGSLLMLWPGDGGLYIVDSDWQQTQPGSPWPQPRHLPLGDGTVSAYSLAFHQQFVGQAEADLVVAMEQSRARSAVGSNAEPARLERISRLFFGELGERLQNLGGRVRVHEAGSGVASVTAKRKDGQPLEITTGATVDLRARVIGPGAQRWQWYREGEPIAGANDPVLRLRDVSYADSGRYSAQVEAEGEGLTALSGELRIGPSTYAAFMHLHGVVGGLDAPFDDFDADGVSNLLEYLAGSDPADPDSRPHNAIVADSRSAGVCLTEISLNPRADDIDWRMEYSADGVDWFDFSSVFPFIADTPYRSFARHFVAYRPDSFLAGEMPEVPAGEAHVRLRVDSLAIDGHSGPCSQPSQCIAAQLNCPTQLSFAVEFSGRVLDGAPWQAEGDPLRLRLNLQNVGTEPLLQARIEAPDLAPLTCQPAQPALLAPAQSLVCEGTRVIAEDDLYLDAIELNPRALALGEGGFSLQSEATLSVPRYRGGPLLRSSKQAMLDDVNGNGLGDVGETISYRLVARNDGDADALDVRIDDPLLPDLDCDRPQPAVLAAGAELACAGTLIITPAAVAQGGELLNVADASTADPDLPGGRQYSQASATVPLAGVPLPPQVFADGFESQP